MSDDVTQQQILDQFAGDAKNFVCPDQGSITVEETTWSYSSSSYEEFSMEIDFKDSVTAENIDRSFVYG